MEITVAQRNEVKAKGFLSNRDGVHFAGRIITENGVLTSEQLKVVGEAAEKFGRGEIAFTSRLTLEVPGIAFTDIEAFQAELAKGNMVTGGTGAKVRPVVACKGSYCNQGLIDTLGLAKTIHNRFFVGYSQVVLPHKFKIAIGGCPNNCVKPDLNDLGIVGQRPPLYQDELCRGCKTCGVITSCPMKVVSRSGEKVAFEEEGCNNCGICTDKCPFGAVTAEKTAYKVYLGGRWGKVIRHGSVLGKLMTETEALDMVEKAILLFKKSGLSGERFGSMVDRLGTAAVEEMLFGQQLLKEKDTILGIATKGGAQC